MTRLTFRRLIPKTPDRRPATRLRLTQLETRLTPASFAVTNLNDSGPGSLRAAVINANNNSGTDFITFSSGLGGTILLTSGRIVISDSVSITGPGASVLTVNGNYADTVIDVSTAPAG